MNITWWIWFGIMQLSLETSLLCLYNSFFITLRYTSLKKKKKKNEPTDKLGWWFWLCEHWHGTASTSGLCSLNLSYLGSVDLGDLGRVAHLTVTCSVHLTYGPGNSFWEILSCDWVRAWHACLWLGYGAGKCSPVIGLAWWMGCCDDSTWHAAHCQDRYTLEPQNPFSRRA